MSDTLRERARQRVRHKGQVTLPRPVRDALNIEEGDDVEFSVTEDGAVTVRGLKSIPADQAWYWTPEWQTGEAEADEQIARGEGYGPFDDIEDMLADLDERAG